MGTNVDEPIHLTDYDKAWPVLFEVEAHRLRGALSQHPVQIEHIGSTAIPGIIAKPVIDIMIGLKDWSFLGDVRQVLVAYGYEDLGEAGISERFYFRRRSSQAFNVHVVSLVGAHWVTNLALRDFLRSHPLKAIGYGALKRTALQASTQMLLDYSERKSACIGDLIEQALQWRMTTPSAVSSTHPPSPPE